MTTVISKLSKSKEGVKHVRYTTQHIFWGQFAAFLVSPKTFEWKSCKHLLFSLLICIICLLLLSAWKEGRVCVGRNVYLKKLQSQVSNGFIVWDVGLRKRTLKAHIGSARQNNGLTEIVQSRTSQLICYTNSRIFRRNETFDPSKRPPSQSEEL